MPTGEDRVCTGILHFRDADAYRSALHESGFEHIQVDGGGQALQLRALFPAHLPRPKALSDTVYREGVTLRR